MNFYETTTTFHGTRALLSLQINQENEMKLYKVWVDVRHNVPNSNGIYGVGGGMKSGYINVQAISESDAIEKAQTGIGEGIEPYICSIGGSIEPSSNRMDIKFASLEDGPYIP